jgi:hypothetical protein
MRLSVPSRLFVHCFGTFKEESTPRILTVVLYGDNPEVAT